MAFIFQEDVHMPSHGWSICAVSCVRNLLTCLNFQLIADNSARFLNCHIIPDLEILLLLIESDC